MSKKQGEKYITINYSYYRKLLRDSYRVETLKKMIKEMHNITKRVDSPDKGRNQEEILS